MQLGEPPTLPELLRLRLPQGIGANYVMFGIVLLSDRTGSRVAIIEDECFRKPENITCRILQEWVQGKGLPVTWESLVETLRDIDLPVLAEEMAAAKLHNS